MNDQQFSGKWVGAYSYSEEYEEPAIRGKTVAFEIDLTVVNGIVKGACTDDEATTHFNQPATIEGSVNDDTISFVKRYPYYWQHELNGQRFLPKLPSQEIRYSGRLVHDRIEGEWVIITTLTDAQGDPISFKGVGHWFMERQV